MSDQIDLGLLEKLCNAFGPTGHEQEVQQIVRNYGQSYCTSVEYDRMGSVIFKKVGLADGPKIMLAGHSDEIGFVITGIEKNGFLTFHQLGGWPDQSPRARTRGRHRALVRAKRSGAGRPGGVEQRSRRPRSDLGHAPVGSW